MTRSRLLRFIAELDQLTLDPPRAVRWAYGKLRLTWPQILRIEPRGAIDPESGESLLICITVTYPSGETVAQVLENDRAPGAPWGRGGDLRAWASMLFHLQDAMDEWVEAERLERGGVGALGDPVAEPPTGRQTLTADEVTLLLLGQMNDGRPFETIRACVNRINKRGGRKTTRTTVLKAIKSDAQLCIWAGRRPANASGKATPTPAAPRPRKPTVDILASGEAEARRVVSQSILEYGSETDRRAVADWTAGRSPEELAELAAVLKPLPRELAQQLPDDVPQPMQVAQSCTETPESIEENE